MKIKPLDPIIIDIDFTPELNHPLVRAYIDPDVELSESHIQCIYEAIQIAQDMKYGNS